jgi:hypothetical protein
MLIVHDCAVCSSEHKGRLVNFRVLNRLSWLKTYCFWLVFWRCSVRISARILAIVTKVSYVFLCWDGNAKWVKTHSFLPHSFQFTNKSPPLFDAIWREILTALLNKPQMNEYSRALKWKFFFVQN